MGALRQDPVEFERIPVHRLTMTLHRQQHPITRREALRRVGNGFAMMAFAGLVKDSVLRADGLHHAPKAKHVIFLFMNGGLSQVDSFDPKPMLDKYDGQPLPGGSIATERKTGELMKSPFKFKKYGQCGMDVSELWPHVGAMADDICWVRSVYTDIPNHEPSMSDDEHRPHAGRPSIDGFMADLRSRHRQQESARVTSCSVRTCRRRSVRRCGTTRSCPRCIRVRSSPIKVEKAAMPGRSSKKTSIRKTHFLHSQRQVHADRTAARTGSAAVAEPDAAVARARRPIRSWKRRSSRWKWRIGCRPRRRKCSTSARNRRPRSTSTAKAVPRGAV